jgi:hypothetical protein
MNYESACNVLNFKTDHGDTCFLITKLLEKYHIEKQQSDCDKMKLKEARDLILLPLVEKQTQTGKIKIKPPFPGIACKDCKGTGKIWTFQKAKISYVCKNCENKGLKYKCNVCNNTGVIKKVKSTGKIQKVYVCTTCKGEGTIEKKMFNPVISFDNTMKLKFKKLM